MSDIIDSLKRLERAGSENSKTTQKLIAAAHELSNLIVEQFAVIGSEGVPVVSLYSKTVYDDNEERFRQVGPDFRYGISRGRLYNSGRPNSPFVDETRDDALAFSKDIADGLLDHIIEALEKRAGENAEGLATIEGAVARLKATREQ
jgi:hypothetical protein